MNVNSKQEAKICKSHKNLEKIQLICDNIDSKLKYQIYKLECQILKKKILFTS